MNSITAWVASHPVLMTVVVWPLLTAIVTWFWKPRTPEQYAALPKPVAAFLKLLAGSGFDAPKVLEAIKEIFAKTPPASPPSVPTIPPPARTPKDLGPNEFQFADDEPTLTFALPWRVRASMFLQRFGTRWKRAVALLAGAFGIMGCAYAKPIAKTALDISDVLCIVSHADLSDDAVGMLCRVDETLYPDMRKLLSERRSAMQRASACKP